MTLPKFDLTKQQGGAIEVACDWYFSSPMTRSPYICIGGLAGTGKTSVIPFFLDKVNVERVAFMAYTGKAANIMQRKGMHGAETIHSSCYILEDDNESKEKLEADYERNNRNSPTRFKKKFSLNTRSYKWEKRSVIKGDPQLVVIDEASMVGSEIFGDLLSYNVPILCIGDFGQLPPIGDDGFNLMAEENLSYKLTEIHRQALNNPIIRISMDIRNGIEVPFGNYEGIVAKIHADRLTEESLFNADQVITGMNNTRYGLNDEIRQIIGFQGDIPNHGERIIVLKNNRQRGVLNGQQFIVQNIRPKDVLTMDAVIVDENDMEKFKAHEDRITSKEKNVESFMHWAEKINPHSLEVQLSTRNFCDIRQAQTKGEFFERVLADWGYAITVHKSQGSEWPKVILYDDHFGGRDDDTRTRWLYTGVTRASDLLIWAQE